MQEIKNIVCKKYPCVLIELGVLKLDTEITDRNMQCPATYLNENQCWVNTK